MRLDFAHIKRTAMVVLFCCLLAALVPAHAQDASPTGIIIVNNAALKSGQMLGVKAYRLEAGGERLVKNIVVGPVGEDCANGCGLDPVRLSTGAGTYRLEVRTDASPALAAVSFAAREGDEYIWLVTNRGNPRGSHATAPGVKIIGDTGPFRIDLMTYTPAPKTAVQAAPKEQKSFLDRFRPARQRDSVND